MITRCLIIETETKNPTTVPCGGRANQQETAMTLRLKRHRETEDTLAKVLEQRDALITKLVRNDAKLKLLQRAKARLERAMAKASPLPVSVAEGKLLPEVKPEPVAVLNDPIPAFLQRTKEKDAAAAQAIRDEQAERKRLKAQVRTEVRKAKQAGDLRKMPLTGKAALAAIRA
jgi:hypothetical protein